jgi:hypothetical protein
MPVVGSLGGDAQESREDAPARFQRAAQIARDL